MTQNKRRTPHVFQKLASALQPPPGAVHGAERWRVALGSAVALGVLGAMTFALNLWSDFHWMLLAPLGATALLIFAVPASPMAQPWPVLLGNTLSAVLAVGVAHVVKLVPVAIFVAVLAAILLMFALRCLHPPGAAMAVLVVSSPLAHPLALITSAVAGSVALVALGVLINRWTGRAYPVPDSGGPKAELVRRPPWRQQDLDEVLAQYNQVLDVSRSQLEELLAKAQTRAYERQLGTLRCRDVMTADPVVVTFMDTVAQAWALMQTHHIKALPVVDRGRQLVGIVSLGDVVGHTPQPGLPEGADVQTQTVAQIMTRRVRVASADAMLVDLVPLFSGYGHHHLPVLDEDNRLVGILTQSDMVGALFRAVSPEAVPST